MANDVETNQCNQSPCSFKFHKFVDQVGEVSISCHIIKMEDCLYLWVGNATHSVMSDLAFALQSKYQSEPIVTKIMGSLVDDTSANIAKRLTKRLGKPVYVSFNVQANKIFLPQVEQRIMQEFKTHKELAIF